MYNFYLTNDKSVLFLKLRFIIYRPFLSFLKKISKLIYHIINMLLLKLKKKSYVYNCIKEINRTKKKD